MSNAEPAAATNLLEIDNLGKRFGGFVALENISLSVAKGERLGLIGPNGSVKAPWSTVFAARCKTSKVRFALMAAL